MNDEFDTPLDDSGTDTVDSSEYDNELELDDFDPEEDTETDLDESETDGEEGEDEDTPEEEPEDEPEQQDAESTEAQPDTVVTLPDGTKTTVEELTKGHLRQADYSRKTADLAESRKAVEQESTRIGRVSEALVEHISALIPNEPDPALAYSNPGQYTAQKASYDSAMAQLQKIMNVASEAKDVTGAVSEQERREKLQSENAKLMEQFPQTKTAEGRKAFFADVQSVAEGLGFSAQELSAVDDSRIFALAHWAQKGMQAEKAKEKVREKAQNAPPAPTRKPGQGAQKGDGSKRRQARAALMKDDSIENAVRLFSS